MSMSVATKPTDTIDSVSFCILLMNVFGNLGWVRDCYDGIAWGEESCGRLGLIGGGLIL